MILNLALIAFLTLSSNLKDDGVPEFKGGQKSQNNFISRSIIYPEYAKQNCLQGTIYISFQLTKSGKIFSSKVQKGLGVDLDKEALRVVRLTSGHWNVPSSFDTTQSIIMPISFTLKEYKCNERSADDIKEAIATYIAREDLTKAVINFYEKKSSGSYSADDESKILALKQQLGYDDKFYEKLIKQGLQKLKQGDKEGACEDFNLVRKLGSDKANKSIANYCG